MGLEWFFPGFRAIFASLKPVTAFRAALHEGWVGLCSMSKARLGNLLSAFRSRQMPRTTSRLEGAGPPLATNVVSLRGRPVIFRSMKACCW